MDIYTILELLFRFRINIIKFQDDGFNFYNLSPLKLNLSNE